MAEEPQYTWAKTWEFFLLGLLRACILTMLPVAVMIGNWLRNWNTPIYWPDVWQLALSCAGPTALLYWRNHWHLLKVPSALIPPDEFLATDPKIQVTKSTSVTVPASGGGTRTVTVEEKHDEPVAPKG